MLHKLLNDLRLRILGYLEISRKSQNFIGAVPNANSHPDQLKFDLFDNFFVNLGPTPQFKLKMKTTDLQKNCEICHT